MLCAACLVSSPQLVLMEVSRAIMWPEQMSRSMSMTVHCYGGLFR